MMISPASIPWSGQLMANYLNGFQLRPNFQVIAPYVDADACVRQELLTPQNAPLQSESACSFFEETLHRRHDMHGTGWSVSLEIEHTPFQRRVKAVTDGGRREIVMSRFDVPTIDSIFDDSVYLDLEILERSRDGEISFSYRHEDNRPIIIEGGISVKLGPEAWKLGLLEYFGLGESAKSPDTLAAVGKKLGLTDVWDISMKPDPQTKMNKWEMQGVTKRRHVIELALVVKPDRTRELALNLFFSDLFGETWSDAEIFLWNLALRLMRGGQGL
jgi:hypothetical protein